MSISLRIVLIVASVLMTAFMLRKIRQSRIQIEDSIFWIMVSVLLIIISVFPQAARMLATLLGIQSTVNFVFLFMIFILVVRLFYMTIRISQLDNRVRELTQKLAIEDHEKQKAEKDEK